MAKRKKPRHQAAGVGPRGPVPRPVPNESAKRGLFGIENIEVTFDDDTLQDDEEAALEHLTELIEWWGIPWHDWREGQ